MIGLSAKQRAIILTVVKGDGSGDFLDLDQLIERLPYKVTKQALQFSLRHLIRRGYIEKRDTEFRRGRFRRVIAPTEKGLEVARAEAGAAT